MNTLSIINIVHPSIDTAVPWMRSILGSIDVRPSIWEKLTDLPLGPVE